MSYDKFPGTYDADTDVDIESLVTDSATVNGTTDTQTLETDSATVNGTTDTQTLDADNASVNAREIYVQPSEPSNPSKGDVWIDTSGVE